MPALARAGGARRRVPAGRCRARAAVVPRRGARLARSGLGSPLRPAGAVGDRARGGGAPVASHRRRGAGARVGGRRRADRRGCGADRDGRLARARPPSSATTRRPPSRCCSSRCARPRSWRRRRSWCGRCGRSDAGRSCSARPARRSRPRRRRARIWLRSRLPSSRRRACGCSSAPRRGCRSPTTCEPISPSSASRRHGSSRPRGRRPACSSCAPRTTTAGRCSSRSTAATPMTASCSRSCGGRSGTRAAARASGCRACRRSSTRRSSRCSLPRPACRRAPSSRRARSVRATRCSCCATAAPRRLEPDDAALALWWAALARLAAAGIAHLRIEPATLALVDGTPALVDFDGATLSPRPDQLATDRAQLLATTAVLAGPERAVAAARAALGDAELTALLPYLQAGVFGVPLRQALKARGIDADDLRAAAAEAVGADEPKLVRLRRVTWWTLVQVALLALAAWTVLAAIGGLDHGQLRESLDGASWWWVAAGFVDRAAAAGDAGGLDARLGAGAPRVPARVRDAARDELHEPGAAVEPRAHGDQHPLLPAAGDPADGGRHRTARSTPSRAP